MITSIRHFLALFFGSIAIIAALSFVYLVIQYVSLAVSASNLMHPTALLILLGSAHLLLWIISIPLVYVAFVASHAVRTSNSVLELLLTAGTSIAIILFFLVLMSPELGQPLSGLLGRLVLTEYAVLVKIGITEGEHFGLAMLIAGLVGLWTAQVVVWWTPRFVQVVRASWNERVRIELLRTLPAWMQPATILRPARGWARQGHQPTQRGSGQVFDISGLNDPLTGAPLTRARGIYRCSHCDACYHTSSISELREANNGSCIVCRRSDNFCQV